MRAINFTDPDDDAANMTFTVSNQVNRTVKVNGVAQTTFTGIEIAANQVTSQPDESGNGVASQAHSCS